MSRASKPSLREENIRLMKEIARLERELIDTLIYYVLGQRA